MNTYDLEDVNQAIQFAESISGAISECPQAIDPLDYNELTNTMILKEGRENDVLWDKGYYSYLGTRALNTLNRYFVNQKGEVYDMELGRLMEEKTFMQSWS